MIFKTVNANLDKASYNAEIKNIDLAPGHWGNEKKMFDYLDSVETFSYDKESFNKNIVLHALKLMKDNVRVKDVVFYRIPEENKLILMAVTDVAKFKDFDLFSREMSITFKREKFVFSIIEILDDENALIKKGEKKIPENWVLDEILTNRFSKLKYYVDGRF